MNCLPDIDGISTAYRDWCLGGAAVMRRPKLRRQVIVERIRKEINHQSVPYSRVEWNLTQCEKLISEGHTADEVRFMLRLHRAPRRAEIVEAILRYLCESNA